MGSCNVETNKTVNIGGKKKKGKINCLNLLKLFSRDRHLLQRQKSLSGPQEPPGEFPQTRLSFV